MYALGKFLAPAIPSCLNASFVAFFHKSAEPLNLQSIVVATHKPYARHLLFIIIEKGEEALFRKLVAHVATKERTMTSRTEVRA